jgi:hypothetical protein
MRHDDDNDVTLMEFFEACARLAVLVCGVVAALLLLSFVWPE